MSVLVLNLIMMHKLHEFVPPFTLSLNVENAQYPAGKHFEKCNTSFGMVVKEGRGGKRREEGVTK